MNPLAQQTAERGIENDHLESKLSRIYVALQSSLKIRLLSTILIKLTNAHRMNLFAAEQKFALEF